MSDVTPMLPMISVIIAVRNGEATLAACLDAVVSTDYPTYEIVVVDDGSTDASPALARHYGARLLTVDGGPRGPAHARNLAAKTARGDILFFIDADVLIPRDTLREVAASFQREPDIAAVFGSYDDSPAAPSLVSQYKNLAHHYVHQHANPDAATFWSGCGAIRRDVFLRLDGFDAQGFPRPSIEDIELGYRLRAAGYAIRLNKQLTVKHLKRWTLAGVIRSDVLDRGIPWTLLILRNHYAPNDLNLRWTQRVSAVLAWAAPGALLAALLPGTVDAVWLLAAALCLAGLGWLNRDFYAFLRQKRGPLFTLTALLLHWLYFIYSTLAFAIGAGLHLWYGRR